MQEKIIKRLVVKQLQKEFPNWRRLPKSKKKQLAKQALKEAVAGYDSKQASNVSLSELTGTLVPPPGIIGLNDMEGFIEKTTQCLLRFPVKRWQRHFDDPELREIDGLLDDRVLNELLAR